LDIEAKTDIQASARQSWAAILQWKLVAQFWFPTAARFGSTLTNTSVPDS
jgi:hypothetical protein